MLIWAKDVAFSIPVSAKAFEPSGIRDHGPLILILSRCLLRKNSVLTKKFFGEGLYDGFLYGDYPSVFRG
jgi:hypothetical protein